MASSSALILPWGKFKGTAIEDVPNSYLRWLAEECKDERICGIADAELKYRETWDIQIYE